MARNKGSANLAASLEVLAGAPLDARLVVNDLTELTASATYPYSYVGMPVYVKSEEKIYTLIAADPTDENNWKAIGSGGGGGGSDSYSDLTNKPKINDITLSGNKTSSDLGLQDVFQFTTMPTASADYASKIVQYIGEATQNYIPGYFYQCDEDAGTYSWVAKNVQAGGGSGGTSDYDELTNKPSINGVTLSGNKTTSDLGIVIPENVSDLTNDEGFLTEVNVEDIADVELTSPTDGQVLKYDATNDKWVNDDDNATVVSLSDIGDVDLNSLEDGQIIKWDSTAEKWVNAAESGGSGGGSTTRAITSVVEVGGIEIGTSYPIGTPIENILADMLEPTLYPTYTAPSASLSYGANQYYAVGANVSALTATLSYDAGAITLNGTKQNDRGGAATNYAIATTGATTEYSDSSGSSGSFNVPALTRATKGTIVLTGTVSFAEGAQPKDSKGNDYQTPLAAGTVSASKTLTFIQPYYYGASNNSTIADFTGLTENVTAKGNKTFNYTTNNQYMIFAYDSSYGNLKSILDSNGFETISGWTKKTLTVGGFSYFVYVSNSPTTDTNAAFTFKY